MTTIQRLDALKIDLTVQGLEGMHGQIEAIKASHLAEIKALQPKPKKVIVKKPKEQSLKVEITEAGKTTEILFDSEAKAEAFLKLKQKERVSRVQLFLKAGGLTPPVIRYGKTDQYKKDSGVYLQKLKNAGLDFHVIISRP